MEQWQFEHPELLWLLTLLPVMALVALWNFRWRKKTLQAMGEPGTLQKMMPNYSRGKRILKWWLTATGLAFLIIAAANPLLGKQEREKEAKGVNLFIALDVSNSMLAEDLTPNRYLVARQFIKRLIDRLKNDKIGLIMFAGNAYLQMPLTTDHDAASVFLPTMTPGSVPTQGTSLSDAMEVATKAFERTKAESRVLMLITDGEDHEEGVMEAAKKAHEEGITLLTVGLGTPKGAPIPDIVNGRRRGFKSDREGNIVLSKLNENILQEVARIGGGAYFRLTGSTTQLNEVMKALREVEQTSIQQVDISDFVSYYQIPLAIGLLLLVIDSVTGYHRNRWWSKMAKS